MEQPLLSTIRSPALRIGLVGAGKGGSALLELLLDWPAAKIAVVIDPRQDAPALAKATALGIPTASHHLEVFNYPVELVLELTGRQAVLNELLQAKPHGVEVIGAGGLRFFWDLLEALKGTQAHIIQIERLRAVGQLANGVAHDFNNLLAAILGRTQLLLLQGQLEPNVQRQLRIIEQAASDGARTVRQILDFTRPGSAYPHVPVDLVQLLGEVREFTRPRWENEAQAAGITYDIRIEAEPVPMISGDPAELREALINLLLNALEAMPRGGQVRFTAAREGTRVRVTIQDTGDGMSEEVRRKAFEPFFTTKGRRGSGLGLSIVWGIVQRHAGAITLATEKGNGTTFTVRFPIRAGVFEPAAPAPALQAPRPATILIIDDEPGIRAVLRELLEFQGHTVVEAPDGATGLARSEAVRVDLVLTDLVMPGMAGWEVAATLKSRAPRLPVGLITGWIGQLDPIKLAAHGVDFVLAKPFQLEEVLRRVTESLAYGRDPSASLP